jgi:hypothetical protein
VKLAAVLFWCVVLNARCGSAASDVPEILRISPTSGPEGTHVEIIGKNLQRTTEVVFGANNSTFKSI